MATKTVKRITYPIGSVSSGTMRPEDLIPTLVSELSYQLKHGPATSRETRTANSKLVAEIEQRILNEQEFGDDDLGITDMAEDDLNALFDALNAYAGPYFYFGAHPGDGADYGYWLSESFDDDFDGLKVNDTSEIPSDWRGEVLHVNDHGNMTLYVKSARKLTEIWGIV